MILCHISFSCTIILHKTAMSIVQRAIQCPVKVRPCESHAWQKDQMVAVLQKFARLKLIVKYEKLHIV
jgi:hypothetical protein